MSLLPNLFRRVLGRVDPFLVPRANRRLNRRAAAEPERFQVEISKK